MTTEALPVHAVPFSPPAMRAETKALVGGWFSFQGMGTTAADLLCRDVICDWLESAGYEYDVAVIPSFGRERGVDWRRVRAGDYSCVVFVSGPMGNGPPVSEFFDHFHDCPKIGIDLTMLQKVSEWNPFTVLIERDSDRTVNPDLAFASPRQKVPVVGVLLAHPQKDYSPTGQHAAANAAFHRLTGTHDCACVPIDTSLDPWNQHGLRTAAEIESLIAKMDIMLTSRLNGLVLSLKNHVPVLAIDPVPGGGKLMRQARILGWPHAFNVDTVRDKALAAAFESCLGEAGRDAARACTLQAVRQIEGIHKQFLSALPLVSGLKRR